MLNNATIGEDCISAVSGGILPFAMSAGMWFWIKCVNITCKGSAVRCPSAPIPSILSLLVLLNAFLARYLISLSLFPLISFTSHHHQAANLSHVSHCILRTKYGRGLNINSICFVSHPFWPLNEIFQDCSDCRNVIYVFMFMTK